MALQLADDGAEIGRLRSEIAERDVEIRTLKLALHEQLSRDNSVLALGGPAELKFVSRDYAASSSLSLARAELIAELAGLFKSESSYYTVLATGSMRPLFDEKAILLVENAPFADLKVGDIVTYRHPRLALPVVHRLVRKEGDRFRAQGDANASMDDVSVTEKNYLKRVYGVLYTQGE